MDYRSDPLVIGGIEGSGSSVVLKIARQAGFHMGSNLSPGEDALFLVKPFFLPWINLFLQKQGKLTEYEREAAKEKFIECLAGHLEHLPDGDTPWGFKVPSAVLMVPFLHSLFPQLKFIHMIRNGLDMVYSPHRDQLKTYEKLLLSEAQSALTFRQQRILAWGRANSLAADYGEREMKSQYLRLRHEDLHSSSGESVDVLHNFLDSASSASRSKALAEIGRPFNLGRWRYHPLRELQEILEVGQKDLERFGYEDPSLVQKLAGWAAQPSPLRWLHQRTSLRRHRPFPQAH